MGDLVPADVGPGVRQPSGRPVIPAAAWTRPLGLPPERVGRPRVHVPMIDDGPWAGVPIGGLGAGSIGPTYRGDFARWHLRVGRHRFLPVAADGWALAVRTAEDMWAGPLAAGSAPTLAAFGPPLPEGGGTYAALFPRAWSTYDRPPVPVHAVCEQLAPILPGNEEASSLPLGLFHWTIENTLPTRATIGLLFSFRDPRGEEWGVEPAAGAWSELVRGVGVTGVLLHGAPDAPADARGTLAVAVAVAPDVTVRVRSRFDTTDGADLWADFSADARLDDSDDRRTTLAGEPLGVAVSATVELEPGERRSIRFALAWDLPIVEFGARRRWRKRYTDAWGISGERAFDIAMHGLAHEAEWRAAIEAWQAPILADPLRPEWYKGALFNELYFLLDGGTFWGTELEPPADRDEASAAADAHGTDGVDGEVRHRFALIECFDYPFYNTVDVNFYASFAILALWPRLELATIRDVVEAVPVDDPLVVTIESDGHAAIRKLHSTVVHDVGGPADDPFHRPNFYKFQDVNAWKDLAPKLVLQAWRDYLAIGDREALRASWPAMQVVLDALAVHDRDGDGLPEHDGTPDQTYDTWPMRGPSAYGGSLWLGALRAAEEIAREFGENDSSAAFGDRFERARASFERRLWADDHYRYDDGGGASSDSIMADQLAGQWYADVTCLGDLVDPAHVDAALRTIHARNVRGFAGGTMGAVNGTRLDGSVDRSSEQSQEVWVGTTYALAAFMIGRGLVQEGWETARGAAAVTYERGMWFRTPEAYDVDGNFRASLYLRPLAIWAIEEALARRARAAQA
jgi:non-lysosomal glucosylceramidase